MQAFILLADNDRQKLAQLQDRIKEQGGRTIHVFPYQAVIAQAPSGSIQLFKAWPDVAIVSSQAIDLSTVDIYGSQARRYASAWNNLATSQVPNADVDLMSQAPRDGRNDAFVALDLPSGEEKQDRAMGVMASASPTPGYYQTSEYLAGSVAVSVVLLESDGEIDVSSEDWTDEEKQQVFGEIVAALDWWAALEPRAHLRFVYEDHISQPLSTSVEPISRPSSDQEIWISDAMAGLGHETGFYATRVRDYDNVLRARYDTNWAFTIFVVDSSNDADGRFSDGYFAYAYLGGPFMILTYDNGCYGPGNLDAVAAHEIGHVFYALDQYTSAQQPCKLQSGYLGIENQNSAYGGCASDVMSIMRGGTAPYHYRAIDDYARGQVGWHDSDADGILDPLDIQLPVTLSVSVDGGTAVVSGTARIVPYPSPKHTSVTINTLVGVQYRLNDGAWQHLPAGGGAFDGTDEHFQFVLNDLPSGLYRLAVAAVDSAGNVSDPRALETIAIVDAIDGGLNTELYTHTLESTPCPCSAVTASSDNGYRAEALPHVQTNGELDDEALTLSGVAYHLGGSTVSGVQYRVNGNAWQTASAQDGAFDSDWETFSLEIDAPAAGMYRVEARAIDADGNVEINFASQEVTIAPDTIAIFLPTILGGAR